MLLILTTFNSTWPFSFSLMEIEMLFIDQLNKSTNTDFNERDGAK